MAYSRAMEVFERLKASYPEDWFRTSKEVEEIQAAAKQGHEKAAAHIRLKRLMTDEEMKRYPHQIDI